MVEDYKFGVLHAFNDVNGGTYDAIEFAYTLNLIDKTKLILYRNNKKYSINQIKPIILDIIHKKYTEGIDFNCNYIQIANDTKKQLVINDDNIQFINDNVFNLDFTKKKFDVILYLNNIFFSHELNNTNLKLHILLCKLQKNTDYFILGDCFEETINYFNVILLKYKYYKKYTYKNIVIYEK